MKKNMMMRIASVLLVAVLLSTCAISGTFAKYTSSAKGNDSARVAYWGWGKDTKMDLLKGLFKNTYGTVDVEGQTIDGNAPDVIAPGTSGTATFKFAYINNVDEYGSGKNITAPEVDYEFTIIVTESCDSLIQSNKNIVWTLDGQTNLTWENLILAILKLSGAEEEEFTEDGDKHTATKKYEAGSLPTEFGVGTSHTISWEWKFAEENVGATKYIIGSDNAVEYDTEGSNSNAMSQDEFDTYMGNAADLDDCSITIEIVITQVTGETTEAVDPAT